MDAWTTPHRGEPVRLPSRTRENEDELPTLVWRARDARRARMSDAERKHVQSGIRRAREALEVPPDWTPAKSLVAPPSVLSSVSPSPLAPPVGDPSTSTARRGRSLLPLVTLAMAAGIALGLSGDRDARTDVVRGLDAGGKAVVAYVERLSDR